MSGRAGTILLDYLLATAVVLAALFFKLSLSHIWDDESPFLLFFISIFLATWRGGFWCGIYATALALVLATYYLMLPLNSFRSSLADFITLAIFTAESVLIIWMIDTLLKTRDQLAKALESERNYSAQLNRSFSQIQQLNERLQLAMTETHHRVKNSLQTISALLRMQIRGGKALSADEVKEIISQVHGISILHDVLTDRSKHDSTAEHVSARDILRKTVPLLRQSVGDRDISFQLDDGIIDVRQASSLIVILNELVSNSIKHGGKRIEVLLRRHEDRLLLQVKDDGKGFPAEFNVERDANTGLRLVQRLSESDFASSPIFEALDKGSRVTLSIPTREAEREHHPAH